MHKKYSFSLLITFFLFTGCISTRTNEKNITQVLSDTVNEPVPNFGCLIDYSPYEGEKLRLELHGIASLSGNVLFLGGQYRTFASPLHSALFLSQDGGKTWNEINLSFMGGGIFNLVTYGKSNIWGLQLFMVEGCCSPEYLIRSTDAGKSWDVISLTFMEQENPLYWVKEFRFDDEKHGLLTIDGSIGNSVTYYTTTGGTTWNKLWSLKTNTSIDKGYRYPRSASHDPLNTALWDEESGFFEIIGALRVRETEEQYLVESYQYQEKKGWASLSAIPKLYVVKNGRLVSTVRK